MKNLVFIELPHRGTLCKNKVYGIRLVEQSGQANTDIRYMLQLKHIHKLGYKTFVQIIVTALDQAYGQFKGICNECDLIHIVLGNKHIIKETYSIFVNKIAETKTKARVYIDTSILTEIKSQPVKFVDKDYWLT